MATVMNEFDKIDLAISGSQLQERRERVFLLLAGVFICAMTILNVIGITRFVHLGPMQLAVGVLPYPITFLCTDLISELYGKARANFLVTVGLFLNGFILLILYVGSLLPSVDVASQPPWQNLMLAQSIHLPDGSVVEQSIELFRLIYACTAGAVVASMVAYFVAQYMDVYLFHFFRKLTAGKHLWLRNNASTLISQAIDSSTVIAVTFGAAYLSGDMSLNLIFKLILGTYLFKMMAALVDTPIIYLLVAKLRPYLGLNENTSESEK